jgi:transcriptional regulator with XRE-family HTH domain
MQQIGQRLKELRIRRNFSQGEIERRTKMLRCYTSRVENGHTVPSLDTLQKFANALEVPLYQLFYEGREKPSFIKPAVAEKLQRKDLRVLEQLAVEIPKLEERDKKILLATARQLAGR